MHHQADANPNDILWRKRRWNGSEAYAESKLHEAMMAFAIGRTRPPFEPPGIQARLAASLS